MYYAAVNSYATDTSVGFSNTWSAIGFATKETRDAYVHCATDMATKAINACDLRSYGEFFATGDTIDTTTGRGRSWKADVTGDVLDAAFPTN